MLLKALVVYDSMYGNTEKIALSIGGAITGDVRVIHVNEANPPELESVSLLIVGSPTQGFRPTKPVQTLIKNLAGETLKDITVAAFDTRFAESDVGTALRLLIKMGGYAAPHIAKELKKKGVNLTVPPEGFIVKGKEGPLKEGELERAAAWAKGIIEN